MGIKESFSLPFIDINSVTIDDSIGNGNSHIDPGETVKLDVDLMNPWHNTGKGVASATAMLTCSTPGVTVQTGSATWGPIAAQAIVTGTPFKIFAASSLTAGQALDFTLTVTSSLGTTAIPFRLRVGTPSGTAAPITYTKTETPGLAIPDNRPNGVASTLSITDDYEISHLQFEINDLTHTFCGDLQIMLKGPTGYGTDPVGVIGGLTDGGSGHNLSNFVVDDSGTTDMLLATPSSPYTGTFKTLFNSPSWTTAGFDTPDGVGQLSRFNGTSPKGTWTVIASDQAAVDTGTLNSWSLIITPVAYTVTPFTCAAPTLTCPSNITVNNDPGQCGATVTFADPVASSECSTPGTPTCTPSSGSFFLLGTTTVNCSVTDDQGHVGSCSFTVTVNGTAAPSISCPANVIVSTANPGDSSVVVTFPTPAATSSCGGTVTVVCSPPSGSAFPKGATTVLCTATDSHGLQSTCSFTVEVFDFVIQDDATGKILRFDSSTGSYAYFDCRKGTSLTGIGTVTTLGCKTQLHDTGPTKKSDRTVDATANRCTKVGSATVTFGGSTSTLNDSNMSNNTAKCGG